MDWLWTRIDRILGAVATAAGAVAGSQLAPLIAQYLRRSGDQLSKAEGHLLAVQTGLKYQVMSETVRSDLAAEAGNQLSVVRAIHDPIASAGVVTKPFALWRNADPALLGQTIDGFVPALPSGGDAVIYAVVGTVLAFLIYELLRWPVISAVTGPPRRRFKRKG